MYSNIKTHKPDFPLCPIISQISTPVYQPSKTLDNIITPYTPNNYSIASTNEHSSFIWRWKSFYQCPNVEETINIIIDCLQTPFNAVARSMWELGMNTPFSKNNTNIIYNVTVKTWGKNKQHQRQNALQNGYRSDWKCVGQ